MMTSRLCVAAATLCLLQSVAGQFELEVRVVGFSDPVDECGTFACDLYIDDLCLKPQSEEEDASKNCSLGEFSGDLNLEEGLPKTESFTRDTQPWPVDFQLYVDINDDDSLYGDVFGDDDVDELVIRESLNASSTFSSEVGYMGNRVTLTLQFRVRCTGGYMGPRCDCLPRNDDKNGHYLCREDGSISCLPGHTNTLDYCRQVAGQFELEVRVVGFSDPVDECGIGSCDLYIDDLCLKPQSEDQESGDADDNCSLGKFSGDLDLGEGLPKTESFTRVTQPWPVDFQLYVDINDDDYVGDDDVDELVIRESLNASSTFSSEVGYTGNRVTLTLQFRVHCTGGYMGPRCDCLPRNDDENGHYLCREDGSISCLPGYTNTSDYCRQALPPKDDECECENGGLCIMDGDKYICVCSEGEKCTQNTTTSFTNTNTSSTRTLTPPTTPGPVPGPRSQEDSSTMPVAAVAGIVAGVLLAVLLCGVLVVVMVYIQCRRRRHFHKQPESQNDNTNGVGRTVSEQSNSSAHFKLAVNPAYGDFKMTVNPTYGNPVPPALQDNGEEEHSIGNNTGDNNQYATPMVVSKADDAPYYNTLNHAPFRKGKLAVHDTLNTSC